MLFLRKEQNLKKLMLEFVVINKLNSNQMKACSKIYFLTLLFSFIYANIFSQNLDTLEYKLNTIQEDIKELKGLKQEVKKLNTDVSSIKKSLTNIESLLVGLKSNNTDDIKNVVNEINININQKFDSLHQEFLVSNSEFEKKITTLIDAKIPDSLLNFYFFKNGTKVAFIGDNGTSDPGGYAMFFKKDNTPVAFLGTYFDGSGGASFFDNNGSESVFIGAINEGMGGLAFPFQTLEKYIPQGSLISSNNTGQFQVTNQSNDNKVIGVADIRNTVSSKKPTFSVISNGIVKVRVNTEGGNIYAGDSLVSSSKSGVATKAKSLKNAAGKIIGKALEAYNTKKKEGFILVKMQ